MREIRNEKFILVFDEELCGELSEVKRITIHASESLLVHYIQKYFDYFEIRESARYQNDLYYVDCYNDNVQFCGKIFIGNEEN